jgi:NAD(P)-dependent dehydrogenase (short-subunit alcohol dehydrogenase family)
MALCDGKISLVTGGGSGIGRATSLAFAREGARVVVVDMRADRGDEVVKMIKDKGGDAIFVQTDVSKAAQVEAMVKKAVEKYGRLDCAFNNAGITPPRAVLVEESEETWDQVMNVNLKGVWLCMKYEILQMLKQGSGAIVNTSSIAGLRAARSGAVYGASKHGVMGLTKAAARQYGANGIRVNVVCPSNIRTEMLKGKDDGSDAFKQWVKNEFPLGRLGEPEEVAEAAVWLCSDVAAFITGATLSIDGGQLT